jgi:hypothetical protein
MLAYQENYRTSWSSLQEPVCTSRYPSVYLRLLAALENGWFILHTEMIPSWDQNGFVYRIQLQQKEHERTEELILPKNGAVDEILEQYTSLASLG